MKRNLIFLILATALFLTACVTEPKPEDTKPYVATVPPQIPEKTVATGSKSDSIPGNLVLKCRFLSPKTGKVLLCGSMTVKMTHEITKKVTEQTLKGDRAVIPVAFDGSYTVEISTKGCEDSRRYAGMTSGMGLTAQFENCK